MKLNAIQVAGLRALSAILDEVPSEERDLSPALKLAFTQGTHYGRAALARELLQAHTDTTLLSRPWSTCKAPAEGSIHLCNCGECVDYRHRL